MLLTSAQPFPSLFKIDVEAPFFFASDNVGEIRLTSITKMGEQKRWWQHADFCCFHLKSEVPMRIILELAWSQPISSCNSRVLRCGSSWINAFKWYFLKSRHVFVEHGASFILQRQSLKRENPLQNTLNAPCLN